MNSRTTPSETEWLDLADRVLSGESLDREDGLAILRAPDEELLGILDAAYRVRRRYFGNRVHLNYLINAKSGHCGEDCGYCSQSRVSTAAIEKYKILEPEQILDGARAAMELKSRTYCIVISGRSPQERELDVIAGVVPEIKRKYSLAICVSPGFLNVGQAERLKACGVDRINHNLNTSRRFYPQICSTHTYQQRLDTLHTVRRAGLEICSGGIIGMGEEDADVVDLALELGGLAAEAVPVNFLIPIEGTALSGWRLTPPYCLKALCVFRLANPRCELRIAGGRELHLGPLQPLGLFPANSIFVSDYLTTKGQSPSADFEMIEALGFEAVQG
jgi:biotin synthase